MTHRARRPTAGLVAMTSATLVATTLLVVPVASPASADVTITTDQFSLGMAPEEAGVPGVPAGYIRLWDMGVAWRDVNPAPGVWVWTVLDQRIAQVEAAGAKVLYVAGLTPEWAASSTDGDPRWGVGSASMPRDLSYYKDYLNELMSRYRSRIAAVEVWNEANLRTFWTGTPVQMANLTALANNRIKANSPGTVVLAASTTTRLPASMRNFFAPYAAAMEPMGFPFDAWSIHTYPAGNASPVERYSGITDWTSILMGAVSNDDRAAAKQVWDTEVNYGLAGPGTTPHTDFDATTSGAYVARTFVDSIRAGIDATFWYLWTNGPYSLLGVQMHKGTDSTIGAYNRVREWTSGATFTGCDTSSDGAIRCFFTKGDPFYIAMSPTVAAVAYSRGQKLTAQTWEGAVLDTSGPVALGIGPVRFTCGAGIDPSRCTAAGASIGGETGSGSGSESTPAAETAPGAPTDLEVTPGNKTVTVKWQAPAADGGSKVLSYTAYATAQGRNNGSCTVNAPARSCTIRDLVNGRAVTIVVRARNSVGQGPASLGLRTTPIAPAAQNPPRKPEDVRVAGMYQGVYVQWKPPASDGGMPVLRYRVTVDVPAGPDKTCIVEPSTGVNIELNRCAVVGLETGGHVLVSVEAKNAKGWGPASAPVWGEPAATGPPSWPLAVTVASGSSTIVTAWQPPTSSGRTPIDHYRVWAANRATRTSVFCSAPASRRTCNMRDVPAGQWFVVVYAVNEDGLSHRSDTRVVQVG
ncbi:MAG: fibronectin type III domain-containing protein [Actinomycetota bacterium]|nr:fibronectin type III domain-containing protein [Actinomycetota bacterium]